MLHLGFNHLTQIPREIGQLSTLTELHLWSNPITDIPSEIGQLTALKELYLDTNHLTQIPTEIGQLSELELLSFYNNGINQLPTEIGQLSALRILLPYSNKLTQILSEIGQLSALVKLDLSYNKLTQIPSEIGQLSALKILKLNNNRLTKIPSEFRDLSALTELDLNNNPLTRLPLTAQHWTCKTIINEPTIRPLRQQLNAELQRFLPIMQALLATYCLQHRLLYLAKQRVHNSEQNEKKRWTSIINKMERTTESFYHTFFTPNILVLVMRHTLHHDVPAKEGIQQQLTGSTSAFTLFFKNFKAEILTEDNEPRQLRPQADVFNRWQPTHPATLCAPHFFHVEVSASALLMIFIAYALAHKHDQPASTPAVPETVPYF